MAAFLCRLQCLIVLVSFKSSSHLPFDPEGLVFLPLLHLWGCLFLHSLQFPLPLILVFTPTTFIFMPGRPPPYLDSICPGWICRLSLAVIGQLYKENPKIVTTSSYCNDFTRTDNRIVLESVIFPAFLLLQLAQFTFAVLSRETAVMDNHWWTAPGL